MRFYFRLGRGIGVSMPWWLALPLYLVWAALLVAVLIVAGIVWLAMRGIDAVSNRRAGRKPTKPDDELPKLVLPETAKDPQRWLTSAGGLFLPLCSSQDH
jgi:hypothetical protein